ncbi:hypothetical protein BO82DRAFT_75867 [Aspergillus uvarum CBS 121591]|uniref:Uncharacterized protein n=1 Tax=Aspergillus uvarum CBS 121591 TaxID=1448315 RepID=A0A319D1W1_9EURO|nr:hypothetical protein BO82DRAFT_75867 [Aspergillus uvarum CBS 121591]PYH81878.1 hypothetical protein BO82DRAFT_75867 [Aspergillus uvarum CBS 121591]
MHVSKSWLSSKPLIAPALFTCCFREGAQKLTDGKLRKYLGPRAFSVGWMLHHNLIHLSCSLHSFRICFSLFQVYLSFCYLCSPG